MSDQTGEKGKMRMRGLVWIAIGAVAWGVSYAMHTPLVLRGTSIPWGAVAIGLGIGFLIYDAIKRDG